MNQPHLTLIGQWGLLNAFFQEKKKHHFLIGCESYILERHALTCYSNTLINVPFTIKQLCELSPIKARIAQLVERVTSIV